VSPTFSTLANIDRSHRLAQTERHENDVEHTLSVAYLCWFIHDAYGIDLDLSKILKYALVHDDVEVYAGDVNSFAPANERQQKIADEAAAEKRLSQEFEGFPSFISAIHDYQERKDGDQEALFVWTVDKIQALIMDDLDNWRTHYELGITFKAFCAKYFELVESSSPHLRNMVKELVDYCIASYKAKLDSV
jgi:putative hydrolase of HD superfamily